MYTLLAARFGCNSSRWADLMGQDTGVADTAEDSRILGTGPDIVLDTGPDIGQDTVQDIVHMDCNSVVAVAAANLVVVVEAGSCRDTVDSDHNIVRHLSTRPVKW